MANLLYVCFTIVKTGCVWGGVEWSTDTWYNVMNLENIGLSGRSQTQIPHIAWLHLYEVLRTGKPAETENRLTVAQGSNGLQQLILGLPPDPISRDPSFASLSKALISLLSLSPAFVSWNLPCTSQEPGGALTLRGPGPCQGESSPHEEAVR